MKNDSSNKLSVIISLGFVLLIVVTSAGFIFLLKKNGLPLGASDTQTQMPTPTPELILGATRKYEIPTDLKGLLTPTPGTDKINFEPELTPTPSPNPLFGEGSDIKLPSF